MLSQDQCNEIEGVLTLDECWAALKSMGTGKSPGEDGFTVEFYRCFFDILGNDLLNSLNAAYENGEMSISQRRGVITLIPKENSDPRELSNWRPITLLNVDYKIASKAIVSRIEKFLPLLINSNQTGFMKGRYIGQNIRLINDIMEQTELQGIPGILLLLDFRKAFDTIEWGFIQQTLRLFNFGSCLRHWVKTLYTNSESTVLHNGFTTDFFKLSRGVRQGCPLSPYLFILGVEILATKIRHDDNVEGIKVFQTEHKISQFADDTTLFLRNLNSVQNSITSVDQFGDISGLSLNVEKTKALWLGPWRFKSSKPFGLKWTTDPVRALGIFISYDVKENNKKNIDRKVDNMTTKLDIWRARCLSLLGKCLVVKCLGIPNLIYSASMLSMPNTYVPSIKDAIFKFIWNNKRDKIKRDVMYQDYPKGGLRAPNIDILFKSFNLAWIQRLLTEDPLSSETWKSIPNHFFNKYGGLAFLLRCNYDKMLLEKSGLPLFYRQILVNFLELKSLYQSNNGSDLLLFNNKKIKIDGNSIFYPDWVEKEVLSIQDLLDHNRKFLSFQVFQQKYNIKCSFLKYFQILSAIPKYLFEKARTAPHVDKRSFSGNTLYQLSNSIVIDLAKMKCKDYYWLYVNATDIEPTGQKKWQTELKLENFRWDLAFTQISKTCKETKLREFNYKLLHRTIVTKKELYTYGIEMDCKCIYCNRPDSILHSFVECEVSKSFFDKVISWFNNTNFSEFSPTVAEILFGIWNCGNDKKLTKFNYCLLFAKFFLYHQKRNLKQCNFNEFIIKLLFKLQLENFL